MRQVIALLILGLAAAAAPARAEWTDLSSRLGETDIQTLAVDPGEPRVLYAASTRRLYKTGDGGDHWKQVLGVRGSDNSIHFILIDPRRPQHVYVASDRGIQISMDAGKKWEYFYRGIGNKAKSVLCLSADGFDVNVLWAGTANGLVRITLDPHAAQSVGGLPEESVYSILSDEKTPGLLWVSTQKGIYKSGDSGTHWQRVHVESKDLNETAAETPLSQFDIEEMSLTPAMSNLVRVIGDGRLYAASSGGILQGDPVGDSWVKLDNARLPSPKVNYLARSPQTFYVATDKGAFQWGKDTGLKDISDGLASKEVRMLAYSAVSDDLFAATKKGVFRYPKPEYRPAETASVQGPNIPPDAMEVLKRFEREPSVRQIQDAAIQYAEVHPDKIKAWREQAARKAFMPTVSLTTVTSSNQNVDIDRGGTNDPDKFIIGPKESSFDWHAGVSWDLGELIWNNDQTSIDTRSRLMVELRDDVLNEVTHLYFERRRLQVEMSITPAKELPLQVERQLKLDELTANIDALTGGFLSRRLEALHD